MKPAAYTFGNAAPYITNADGIINLDIAIQKVFPINERHSIEFRTEFFNFPNTVTFNDPNGDLNNGNFGRVSSQRLTRGRSSSACAIASRRSRLTRPTGEPAGAPLFLGHHNWASAPLKTASRLFV